MGCIFGPSLEAVGAAKHVDFFLITHIAASTKRIKQTQRLCWSFCCREFEPSHIYLLVVFLVSLAAWMKLTPRSSISTAIYCGPFRALQLVPNLIH